MANITKWFGHAIYINSIQNFKKLNKKIVPIIIKDIVPTNSQYARTTDINQMNYNP
jgi:hypothetical protein